MEQYYANDRDYDDYEDARYAPSYRHALAPSRPFQLIRRSAYDSGSPDARSPSPVQVIYEGDYRPDEEEIIEYYVREPPAKPIVRRRVPC